LVEQLFAQMEQLQAHLDDDCGFESIETAER
jgi:hypothetical protein